MTEIKNGKTVITTPVTDEDIKNLHAGDTIYLSGDLFTGRDAVHERVTREGRDFPGSIKNGAVFHAGPIVRQLEDGSYEMVSIGPTTSMRMERFEYDFIRETGVKIVIGKGGMKDDTARGCKEFCAIHCAAPAGCAVVNAVCVEETSGVEWADLGMPEAVWVMKVKEFGPLIVTIDTEGNNYFENKKKEYNARKDEQAERITEEIARW